MQEVCRICGKENGEMKNESDSMVLIICENCLKSEDSSAFLDQIFLKWELLLEQKYKNKNENRIYSQMFYKSYSPWRKSNYLINHIIEWTGPLLL